MATIDVFYQGEGIDAFERISVSEDATAETVLNVIKGERGWTGEEWLLFIEDDDTIIEPITTLRDRGVKHRHRLHVHRCRRVTVNVTYNQETRSHEFAPSTTVGRVKDYFIGVFHIDPIEAPKLALLYGDPPQIAEDDDHIGRFVTHPTCSVNMQLAPKARPQG